MTAGDRYHYTTLTRALDDLNSPLRRYMEGTFPNRKSLQAAYRAAAGELLVPGKDGVNPGTLGAAFEFMVRLVLAPAHVPQVALAGALRAGVTPDVLVAVVRAGHEAAITCRRAPAPEELAKAAWALALLTEVYRVGTVMPGSPLSSMTAVSPPAILDLASDAAVSELQKLHELAIRQLYPALPKNPERVVAGPTFTASRLCAADADVALDNLLLETKARLGSKNARTGNRTDSLGVLDLYQMLGYVLFDYDDVYSLQHVSFYSARYGALTKWPLHEFLEVLHGGPVDLAAEREQVWTLLGGSSGR